MAYQPTDSLSIPDTISRYAGADTLPLSMEAPSSWCPQELLNSETHDRLMSTADAVYGALSELSAPSCVQTATDGAILTGNIFFNLAALVCFILICLALYLYHGYIFGIFAVFRGRTATEKIIGEQSKVLGEFLSRTITTGLFVAGLTALKFADPMLAGSSADTLSGLSALGVIVGAWAVMSLIWGFQFVLLRIAGNLTLYNEFTAQLFFFRKITFAMWTITVLPVFLLLALSGGHNAHILKIIITVITAMASIFLITKSFTLFIRHNFSILLWILYLCAVEIFPVSLVAILIWKFLV